jgi:hypothetical protein
MKPQVFIVFLRQPRKGDARHDPFWEFGSFGCTGCHMHNLLNPSTCRIRKGDRLAFVQGGALGCRLLLVTPPVRRVSHPGPGGSGRLEIRWQPSAKPFRYGEQAPLMAGNVPYGSPEFPKLSQAIAGAARTTWAAKLASHFRARARALEEDLADEVLTRFERARRRALQGAFIRKYADALPTYDQSAVSGSRRQVYLTLSKELADTGKRAVSKCGLRGTRCSK